MTGFDLGISIWAVSLFDFWSVRRGSSLKQPKNNFWIQLDFFYYYYIMILITCLITLIHAAYDGTDYLKGEGNFAIE